jgi:hypothetical protein
MAFPMAGHVRLARSTTVVPATGSSGADLSLAFHAEDRRRPPAVRCAVLTQISCHSRRHRDFRPELRLDCLCLELQKSDLTVPLKPPMQRFDVAELIAA